ncbi:tetratricopeptide repeat protein [Bacteroides salyersiae]|uniref:tetratricopeptide repeat-containing sensor histidine kinase n=1 Tax=Bacteroides salyersiae TaxID=291644 RepID=UPI001C0205AB|nr:tetratricopeptide repeat protein [Bacteroides salyersiae]MBT9874528.1 tetratricopeptide repeat protein [Bacteroides salyersiae]
MKNYLFVLSLLLVCFPVSANDDALLDSLRLNLETAEGKTGNALAEAYSDLGDYYMYKQPDSAYYYFQKGIDHLHNHTDFCYSGLLSNMATYYYSIGDIDKALSSYLFALQEAVRLGHDEISTLVSSSLGVIYRRKEMPDSALYYYNRALEFAEHQNDFATIANLYTNIAVLYSATSRLSEAIPYAEKAVGFSLKGNDPVQTVYSYSVYGSLLIKNKEWEKASQILRSGVAESKKMQSSQLVVKCITPLLSVFDCLGQADSVKYYMDIAEKELPELSPNAIEVLGFYEVKGELFNRYGQYRESLEVLKKIENLRGKNLHTPLDLLYFRFASNYYGLKDFTSAYVYMKKAYLAKDSLFAGEVQKQLSDMTVKYQTKEKELEIAQLKQIQTEQHALMVKRIFYLVLFLLVLIAAFLVLLYKKKALEKETDLRLARQYIDGLESERKRLAKELHDGVCNDLLGIQYYMQTSDAIGKEVQQKLFPMIEQTRTDVRFISHELMPPAFQYANLNVMLEDYVERLGNVHQLIHFHYFSLPEQANWELVSCQKAYELYRIVQEVLGNSLSHSKATEIEIILSMIAEERKIVLTVSDNAKGASVSLASGNGIGLRTVEDRVKCIDGVYSLTSDAKGTSFIVETGI